MLKQALPKFCVLTAAAALAGLAEAKPILWYHFAPDAPQAVNAVSPGTWDGTVRSYTYKSGKITYGDDSANMPVYDGSFTNDFPRVLNQTNDYGGAVVATGGALNWTADDLKGGVVVDDAGKTFRPQKKFTIEAFVKLPADAAGHATTRKDEMFPIAQLGEDMKNGWMFSVFQGCPFFRFCWKKADGTLKWNGHGGYQAAKAKGAPILYDGKWHHVAVTFYANNDQCCARVFQDGTYIGAARVGSSDGWPSENGIYYGEEGEALPFVVGGKPQSTTRCYYGELAEFRVSDENLLDTGSRFMVPMVNGPVDEDTAVMLQFGENAQKFGPDLLTNVTFTCDSGTHHWIARNWNLLNAATTDPWQPRWYPYDGEDYLHQMTDGDAPGETVGYDSTSARAFADGKSLKFAPSCLTNNLINIPRAYSLPDGDFTIEFFLKTSVPDGETVTVVSGANTTFVNKWCVYKGQFLFRNYNPATDKTFDRTSAGKVNDGQWHHLAIAYRHETKVIDHYLDYKLFNRTSNVGLRPGTSGNFFIGGTARYGESAQLFKGNIDNFRITRRALRVSEFLSGRGFVSDKLMDAAFEGDLTTGQDPAVAKNGEPVAFPDGEEPTYVTTHRGWVLDGEGGERIRPGGQSLRLKGGYAYWKDTKLLEHETWTVEFFAKFYGLQEGKETFIVRYNQGQQIDFAPIWALSYRHDQANKGRLVFQSFTSTNDYNYAKQQIAFIEEKDGDDLGLDDGKWHHWAMTVAPSADGSNVVAALYRDYAQWGKTVTVKGRIFYPNSGAGSSLAVGGGENAAGRIDCAFDDLRISPGVLPAERFMRFEKEERGLTILFR